MDLYFQRHDGQAVTCDDFAQAIADANRASDLVASSSAGTARPARRASTARGRYDAAAGTYTLTLSPALPADARPGRQAAAADPAASA